MSNNITVKDNIILFPKQKKEAPERKLSDKEIKIAMEAQARLFAQQLKDVAMDDLFALLDRNSLDTDTAHMSKDLAFVAETIVSLIYREFKIKHPMQTIVDSAVKINSVDGLNVPVPMVTYENILVKKQSKKPEDDKKIP